MNQLLIFFLPLILYIGIKTSISDYKIYKIKNKDIITGFIIGIILYTITYILTLTNTISLNYLEFLKLTLINFTISFIIGVGLWLNKLWNAADAKLFMLYSFLTPITIYENNIVKYFESFNIIIHTFLVITIIMFIEILIKGKYTHYKDIFISIIKSKEINPTTIGTLFILHWLLISSIQYLSVNSFIIFSLFIFLFAGPKIGEFFSKQKYLLLILVIIRLIFNTKIYNLGFLYQFIIMVLIYLLIVILQKIPEKIFTTKLEIEKIKSGMLMKYSIVKHENKYIQLTPKIANQLFKTKTNKEQSKTQVKIIIENNIRGLNDKDVKKLKQLYSKKQFNEKIIIQEHTCFAPYLFAGTLITIIFNGNLISYIKSILL